jgi:glycine hydroxymethyltransferase
LKPEFIEYIKLVISNAKILAEVFVNRGFRVVTGGTDSHLVWLDLSPKNLTGDKAEKLLENIGIACNKNAIPYDLKPPKITSGIRFGTAAATSRGFNNEDFKEVGNMISDILDSLLLEENEKLNIINKIKEDVVSMCSKYPIYDEAY